jgi:hypothetical protein
VAEQPDVETVVDVAEYVRDARRSLMARPQYDEHGNPLSGNTRTMTIGHRSAQMAAALEPIRQAVYRATLADMGCTVDGSNRPTEAQRITARNLATLDMLAETFWTWIEQQGVMTSKGKTRAAVTTLLSIIDRQTKLAQFVGLDRRQRGVNVAEEFAQMHEAQSKGEPR